MINGRLGNACLTISGSSTNKLENTTNVQMCVKTTGTCVLYPISQLLTLGECSLASE